MLVGMVIVALLIHLMTSAALLLFVGADIVVGRTRFVQQNVVGVLNAVSEPYVTVCENRGAIEGRVSDELKLRAHFLLPAVLNVTFGALTWLFPSPFLRARVAPMHIFRAVGYGFGFVFIAALIRFVGNSVAVISAVRDVFVVGRIPNSEAVRFHEIWPLLGVLSTAWVLWWWYTVISTGWRVQRPVYVTCVLAVPALQVALIVTYAASRP